MKTQRLKILKLFLVVLFISYYFETTLFYHTHHFSWGSVTHSHPCLPASNGIPHHGHTADQCQALALLSTLILIIAAGIAACLRNSVVSILFLPVFRNICVRRFSDISLRAPPAFIC